MKLHLITKNTVQEFDASLPSNEDIVQVYQFQHEQCICFDEAINADIIAYAFINGLIKLFFKDREPRFVRVGTGIIGMKFSDDGTYLSVLKQEGTRVILHIIEIQNLIPVFTHVLLYSPSDIKEYYLSNTTFYYIVQNEFMGTFLHQIKFPYQFFTLIPGVRLQQNIDFTHFHHDHVISFDPETMCLKKYDGFHTNSIVNVSSALNSQPLRIATCNRNVWCICENDVYVFNIQNLELLASTTFSHQINIDNVMSYGNTCFCTSKRNPDDSIEFVKFTCDQSVTNEISKTLTRRFILDDVSTILLRDSDFSYNTTTSSHPIVVNHSGFVILIPGIDYSHSVSYGSLPPLNLLNNNNDEPVDQAEFIYQQEPDESNGESNDESNGESDDNESDDESYESDEEEQFHQILQQSLINYQSKGGLQRVIDFIRSSLLNHTYWANVQQFSRNEWCHVKSCITTKKLFHLELSIETHTRIVMDTENIIKSLKKECHSFAQFFNVSENIGEFDGGLSTDVDHENFNVNDLENVRVTSIEKKMFSEQDILLSHHVPICNLTHARLLKVLFDEISSNEDVLNCVTTGIIPTLNILIAQLNDFVHEINIHIKKIEKMNTWFKEQQKDVTTSEPKKKHARIV